jgi:hypothetical protein
MRLHEKTFNPTNHLTLFKHRSSLAFRLNGALLPGVFLFSIFTSLSSPVVANETAPPAIPEAFKEAWTPPAPGGRGGTEDHLEPISGNWTTTLTGRGRNLLQAWTHAEILN